MNNAVDIKKAGMAFFALCATAILIAAPEQALAGTGGTAFEDVWIWLKENIEGTLGRIICGAIVIVGIGGGMGLYNTPTIIESIVSATVEHADKAATAIMTLSNGL